MTLSKLEAVILLAATAGLAGCDRKVAGSSTGEIASETGSTGSRDSKMWDESAGTAEIRGIVRFAGVAPERKIVGQGCGARHPGPLFDESVIVNENRTLRNVFVHVLSGLGGWKFPAPSQPALLDQKVCAYVPHVLGVRVGQTLRIRNGDSFPHNSHTEASLNPAFNIGQTSQGDEYSVVFQMPEVMKVVKCDAHPWMSAWVGIVSHPYFAVTGDDGSFRVPHLPPGEYVIEAWHEKYGSKRQIVKIGDGECKEADFSFAGGSAGKLLATIPDSVQVADHQILFSPDGLAVAYVARRSGKSFVVFGGRNGEDFDQVEWTMLSPDGTQVAYGAKKDRRWSVIVGDRKGEEFDFVLAPVFSPNGKSVAYGAKKGGKGVVVVDGRLGQEFEDVTPPIFSPDGKTAVYVVGDAGKGTIVVRPVGSGAEGEVKGEAFDDVSTPVFSPDGNILAHGAKRGRNSFLVVGGTKGEEYDFMSAPVFSPDGKSIAYAAKKSGKGFVVVADKKGREFDDVGSPVFSPDGSSVAYAAKKDGKWFIIAGDTTGEKFDSVQAPVFGPDAKTVAYSARNGAKAFVVLGGEKGPEFDDVSSPTFSPNGRIVAYEARKGGKGRIVVGARMGSEFDFVRLLGFSPEGTTLIFGARLGREIRRCEISLK